ncbi:MAG: hypothetical protein ACI945_000711, partial [Pseudohongiellaceae bacterium]
PLLMKSVSDVGTSVAILVLVKTILRYASVV